MYAQAIEAQFDVHHWEGDEAVCKCPWHDDTGRPNLYVNASSGLYNCFVCNAKGKLKSNTVPADQRLGALRSKLHQQEAPVKTYPEEWLDQFVEHPYWHEVRKFSDSTIARFRLGYDAMAGKLTIPIHSASGTVLGVIYRRLDNAKPKYLHPHGFQTSRNLFGAHLLTKQRKVALVEGPLDAVACWDANIPALAAYGARLSAGQAQLLRRLGVQTVVVMTDNDTPGRMAVREVKRAVSGVSVLVGQYEPHWSAKDPGELSKVKRKQMYHSAVPFHVWPGR